jgi:signal transduction histidine kinase
MINLYDAAAVLVVAGTSIGLVLLYLRRQSRLHRLRMGKLLALRHELHDDPLATLTRHQATLANAGLQQLDCLGNWYGTPVAIRLGRNMPPHSGPAGHSSQQISQRFDYDDIALTLRIGLAGLRGERRLFALQAAQVLFAMLQGALAARQLALVAATNQRAKVGVFLQHDMRNLAQWVQLVAEDFEAANTDEQLMARAKRLRSNAPQAASRAQRMSQAMLNPTWQPSAAASLQGASNFGAQHDDQTQQDELDLTAYIEEAAQMHQVNISLAGSAIVDWDAAALVTVLDNLLGNVSSLSRDSMQPAQSRVVIESLGDKVDLRFETPHLPLEIPLEKLFEPWASSRNTNKGLGLYQARKQVLAAGGQLTAQRLEKGISVTLSIPCKKS